MEALYGTYSDNGILVFLDTGKYTISGALTIEEYEGEKICVLVVVESDLDVFLTNGMAFDIFTENL